MRLFVDRELLAVGVSPFTFRDMAALAARGYSTTAALSAAPATASSASLSLATTPLPASVATAVAVDCVGAVLLAVALSTPSEGHGLAHLSLHYAGECIKQRVGRARRPLPLSHTRDHVEVAVAFGEQYTLELYDLHTSGV